MVVYPRRLTSAICIILGCSVLSIGAAEEKDKNNKGPNPPAAVKAPPPPPHINAPAGGGNVGHPGVTNSNVHTGVSPTGGNGGFNANAVHGNSTGGSNLTHTQNAITTNPGLKTTNPGGSGGGAGLAHPSTVQHTTNVPATGNINSVSHSPTVGGVGGTGTGTSAHPPVSTTTPSHTLNTTGLAGHPATSTGPTTGPNTIHAPVTGVGAGHALTTGPAAGTGHPITAGATTGLSHPLTTNPVVGTAHPITGGPAAGLAHPLTTAGPVTGKSTLPGTLGKPAYTAPPANAIAAHGANNTTVLTPAGSQSVLGQVNGARGGMHGVNAKPLPTGQVTTHPNGALTLKTNSAQYNVRPNGSVASYQAHGQTATFHANGSFASVHAGNMDINHSPNGQRVVFGHQPDHSLLVNTGWHSGYRESGVAFGGHSYLRRDYAYGHEHFSSYYSPYHYHGLLLAAFVATAIYVPAYYAWSYHPWGAPVAYNWGWRSSPWYGYYGNYFEPYPTYVGPNYWLTDYALAGTLETGYDQRPEEYGDTPASPGQLGVVYDAPSDDTLCAANATPITPELKDAIAQEVAHQLQLQQQAATAGTDISAAGSLQNALLPNQVFIVDQSLAATTPDQRSCGLSAGDVLQLQGVPGANDENALLAVASGRRNDCPAGTQVQLSLQNLQDMQNNLSARIDTGLASLQKTQGTNGLPAAPGDALAPPKSDVPATPDGGASDVQALLDSQWQQANQAETEVQQGVAGG